MRRGTAWLAAGSVVLGLLLPGCGHSAAAGGEERTTFVVTGSSTLAPLVAEVARRFEDEHPHVRIDVQTGGSSRGIRDVREGRSDVGMSSRPLFADERDGLVERVAAWDGVAFVVHASNTVAAPSVEQLRGLLDGDVVDWSQLGADEPRPITVIQRAAGRSERELVAEHFGLGTDALVADAIAGETPHVIKTVTANPTSIAYNSLGATEIEIARGAPLRLLPLDGVPATSDAVAAGRYPLARPLLLLTRPDPPPLLAAFLARFADPALADLVRALGYVPAD